MVDYWEEVVVDVQYHYGLDFLDMEDGARAFRLAKHVHSYWQVERDEDGRVVRVLSPLGEAVRTRAGMSQPSPSRQPAAPQRQLRPSVAPGETGRIATLAELVSSHGPGNPYGNTPGDIRVVDS